jgi:hypothetical protein
MQVQTMDQMMDVWEGQIKSPTSPSDILSKIKSFSSFGSASWPNADAFQMATLQPLQAYVSFVEQWQKDVQRQQPLGRNWRIGPA